MDTIRIEDSKTLERSLVYVDENLVGSFEDNGIALFFEPHKSRVKPYITIDMYIEGDDRRSDLLKFVIDNTVN
jgi:hypothetical protein